MTGLVALFLPLFLGGLLAVPLALLAKRDGMTNRKTDPKPIPPFLRAAFRTVAALAVVALILSLTFASLADTLDGRADPGQYLSYAGSQFGLMAILAFPATLFAYRDGKFASLDLEETGDEPGASG